MSTTNSLSESSIDTESRLKGTIRELRHSPTAIAGAAIVGILVVLAIFSTIDLVVFDKALITAIHENPHAQNTDESYSAPSLDHPMGTDDFGRDVLSRIIYGSRIALAIGIISVGISFLGGIACGAAAAYFGGRIDDTIMRLLEVLYSIPSLILAMTMMAIMGPSVYNLFLAYGVIGIPAYARVMRSEVLSLREEEYVEAARAAGLPKRTILFREIVPNGLAAVVVQATLSMGSVIIGAAALSFLGFGVQPPTASWGRMLSGAQEAMIIAPWVAFFPGLMIFITVMGFNMLGDGLRDAMDPRTTLRKANWDELDDDFLPSESAPREEPDAVADRPATDGGTDANPESETKTGESETERGRMQ
ncbi:peptide/nickel transport system permease protein [Haladaptatus litoreus]|uniref:Peptide/nickel transport system permease protein n=1 Tax=Haladaptatus litoreus TaxID=553468 RepID=A0A1N7B2D7_9EURY|nr:ABC transporter permease [Haladaptatus litoreus]SIR45418.1 peptide/nickel transport system permease protein [Haladaptatus litoreus]